MSKSAKLNKSVLARKRRAEIKALYKAQAGTLKEHRAMQRKASFNGLKHRHATSHCGNVGCGRCFPKLNRF
jgi:hypothetical protein